MNPKILADALAPMLEQLVARAIAPLIEAIRSIEQAALVRIEALEKAGNQTLADSFKGTWQPGNSYERGSLVVWEGSLWIAMSGDTAAKPGSGDDFRLVTKRGRDGKDLRP